MRHPHLLRWVFEIAEAAKRQGYYPVANAAFAVLVLAIDSLDLKVELETRDPDGEYPEEAYYNLLVLRYTGKAEEDFEGYLCIPVPLVGAKADALLMERAKVVWLEDHCRRIAPQEEHLHTAVLWACLEKATGFSREQLDAACAEVLCLGESA